ncbi:hypothetical protein Tco_0601154 [Tanacetum coccineum]
MAEVQMTADDNVSATGQQILSNLNSLMKEMGGPEMLNMSWTNVLYLLILTDDKTIEISDHIDRLEKCWSQKDHCPVSKNIGKLECTLYHLMNYNYIMENNVLKLGQHGQIFEEKDSGLVLHQMKFDYNRFPELEIQDHSNEQSSSKLVPKVVPLAVKTATSRQELELLFHLHIAMLRTTGPELTHDRILTISPSYGGIG